MKLLGTHGKEFWTCTGWGHSFASYIFTSQRVGTNTMYRWARSGLVNLFITNANMKASLSGACHGYMPPVLKVNKQSFEYCNSKIISTSLTARNGNAHLQNKLRLIILLPSLQKLTQKLICDLTNFLCLW